VERFLSDVQGGIRLINSYGPTEASVNISVGILSTGFSSSLLSSRGAPIGLVLDNYVTFLAERPFDGSRNDSFGELFVGGNALARGYLNELCQTAFSFLPASVFSLFDGSRVYATGDQCWYDSTICSHVVLGRIDHQAKVRGCRTALGQIESVLSSAPGAEQCVDVA